MKSLIKLFILLCMSFAAVAQAQKFTNAQITGDTYFGTAGKKANIKLKSKHCEIESVGSQATYDGLAPKEFKIIFSCETGKQILWDISKPAPGEFNFDDPRFSLIWAGDQDGDGKIDLKMEMSPKYSCSKVVTYLSTKAKTGDLVGIVGSPKTQCGD